ncbi:MAG: hypothetical protein EZS28_010574 [Streblomastix strix]|uniref:Uncharacterized protein n=1 Tax=Streblomastix strix TaxID=222440 RepID=A0A5J4WFY6_9EUKA|nr:MAG: hypothetical protein EZS28_010574 [Streblomastix strix]
MINAHNKQFFYYLRDDQLGIIINGHKRHFFMCCQTFENGKQCAWKEYRCDTPNDMPKRNQEFFDHLNHRYEPMQPKFCPVQLPQKTVTYEEVSMPFLVFISYSHLAFRSVSSDSFFNFVYAAMLLAGQSYVEIHFNYQQLAGKMVSICIDSAKILENKLAIATIKETFGNSKPFLVSCFKGPQIKIFNLVLKENNGQNINVRPIPYGDS